MIIISCIYCLQHAFVLLKKDFAHTSMYCIIYAIIECAQYKRSTVHWLAHAVSFASRHVISRKLPMPGTRHKAQDTRH